MRLFVSYLDHLYSEKHFSTLNNKPFWRLIDFGVLRWFYCKQNQREYRLKLQYLSLTVIEIYLYPVICRFNFFYKCYSQINPERPCLVYEFWWWACYLPHVPPIRKYQSVIYCACEMLMREWKTLSINWIVRWNKVFCHVCTPRKVMYINLQR